MECKFCKKSFENWTSLLQHEEQCKKTESTKEEVTQPQTSKSQTKFERLYKNKLRDCQRISKESQKKIKILNDQLKELKINFDDPKFNAFSNHIVNSETVNDYFRICELVSGGQVATVSKKLLTSFQKLIVGLSYGVVPITVTQRLHLTSEDRNFIAKIEDLPLAKLKKLVLKHRKSFVNIVDVLRQSIIFLKNVLS